MQVILTQSIVIVVIISIAMFITDFICGVCQTPQHIVVAEAPVVATVSSSAPVNYATLDWFVEPTSQEHHDYWLECEIQSESTDIIELAKAKLKLPTRSLLNATIRELKKLASDRKLKGYSKLNKAQLILALQFN